MLNLKINKKEELLLLSKLKLPTVELINYENKEQCRDTYILAAKLAECSKNKKGKFRTSAFLFRPYHGTELYNMLNKKITYKHNDSLDVLKGRSQFNFMSENFSECSQEFINKIVIETNNLGSGIETENDREDKEL